MQWQQILVFDVKNARQWSAPPTVGDLLQTLVAFAIPLEDTLARSEIKKTMSLQNFQATIVARSHGDYLYEVWFCLCPVSDDNYVATHFWTTSASMRRWYQLKSMSLPSMLHNLQVQQTEMFWLETIVCATPEEKQFYNGFDIHLRNSRGPHFWWQTHTVLMSFDSWQDFHFPKFPLIANAMRYLNFTPWHVHREGISPLLPCFFPNRENKKQYMLMREYGDGFETFMWRNYLEVVRMPSPPPYPRSAPIQELQKFWNAFPANELSTWEVLLQRALERATGTWSCKETRRGVSMRVKDIVKEHNMIASLIESYLPDNVSLDGWIRRRIPSLFHVEVNIEGDSVVRACRKLSQEDKSKKTMEFLNSLPKESLTREESILRSAILNFLEAWSGEHEQVPATTKDLDSCLIFQEAQLNALPAYVSLQPWCEARLDRDVKFYSVVEKVTVSTAVSLRRTVDSESRETKRQKKD